MRAAAFETIYPSGPVTALPLNLIQTASRSSPVLILALALPAACAALIPLWLIAKHAAHDTSILFQRPDKAFWMVAALVLWVLLFGWPIALRAVRFGYCRQIEITGARVNVSEGWGMWCKTWSEPVAAYVGLAHHVRASLSGTRHELILIHPERERSLLLHAGDKISQAEIDQLTRLLGCREIAPQLYYRKHALQSAIPSGGIGGELAAAG